MGNSGLRRALGAPAALKFAERILQRGTVWGLTWEEGGEQGKREQQVLAAGVWSSSGCAGSRGTQPPPSRETLLRERLSSPSVHPLVFAGASCVVLEHLRTQVRRVFVLLRPRSGRCRALPPRGWCEAGQEGQKEPTGSGLDVGSRC